VGRSARAALIPRRYLRLKQATRGPVLLARTPVLMSRDQVVVAREASSGNLLRTNSAVTRFPVYRLVNGPIGYVEYQLQHWF
jgi:hypothetical protein